MAERRGMQALSKADVQRLQSAQVITRLADAVKELVENAIDAGAKKVAVKLTNHGIDVLEVTDDGSGINAADFEHLVTNHATSKLQSFSDLDKLKSLGFRGEALSSICTVGDLVITTCTQDTVPRGTQLVYRTDGLLTSRKVVPAQVGTQVKVSDLFSGLPVRRKDFEKNAKRDLARAVKAVEAIAIARTDIRFELLHMTVRGRSVMLNTLGSGSLRKVISEVVNPRLASTLVEFRFEVESTSRAAASLQTIGSATSTTTIVFSGIMSPPTYSTSATSDRQFCSINARPCHLPQVCRVFNELFEAVVGNRTPFLAVNLEMPGHAFDVNVSPDKRTVFLHNEAEILPALRDQLSAFLESDRRQLDAAPMASQALGMFSVPGQQVVQGVSIAPTPLAGFTFGESIAAARAETSGAPAIHKRKRSPPRTSTQSKLPFVVTARLSPGADVHTAHETGADEDHRDLVGYAAEDAPMSLTHSGQNSMHEAVELNTDNVESHDQAEQTDPTVEEIVHEIEAEADDPAIEDDEEAVAVDPPQVDLESQQAARMVIEDAKPRPLQRFVNRLAALESAPAAHQVQSVSIDRSTNGLLQTIRARRAARSQEQSRPSDPTSEGSRPTLERAGIDAATEQAEAESVLTLHLSKDDFFAMTIVGQFNLGFIVCRDRSRRHLFIVDQHASDEKYNYERLMRDAVIHAQPLAVPLKLELGALDRVNIRDHLPLLKKNGFEVVSTVAIPSAPERDDELDKDHAMEDAPIVEEDVETFLLKSLPVSGKVSFNVDDLREILDAIVNSPWRGSSRGNDRSSSRPTSRGHLAVTATQQAAAAAVEVRDDVVRCTRARRMFASRACRSSIMIGKVLTKDRMRALLWHMGTMDRPWHCPHGRPTCRHLLDLRSVVSWRAK